MPAKPMREDHSAKIRYLLPDEDTRLREALDAREAKRREGRRNFNRWRANRGYKLLPE